MHVTLTLPTSGPWILTSAAPPIVGESAADPGRFALNAAATFESPESTADSLTLTLAITGGPAFVWGVRLLSSAAVAELCVDGEYVASARATSNGDLLVGQAARAGASLARKSFAIRLARLASNTLCELQRLEFYACASTTQPLQGGLDLHRVAALTKDANLAPGAVSLMRSLEHSPTTPSLASLMQLLRPAAAHSQPMPLPVAPEMPPKASISNNDNPTASCAGCQKLEHKLVQLHAQIDSRFDEVLSAIQRLVQIQNQAIFVPKLD